ncbi:GspE/PulE family protein [Megasphaera sp.]|uniref:GspE/PulE family protein n=1 Tax=Megasphaera sp. TaxID=2023260 RepID=UPI0025C5194D|nr:GspE/PulE family protein [Megasphaera sp.]MCF0152234.1 type II/IV secretion system protein [Megasphaera sp.]
MDVNKLLQDALAAGASDIHIEPMDDAVRIRWRRDGVLCQAGRLHKSSLDKLVSRIKVLAGLDIANRRLPQDGRIIWKDGGRRLDLRVSTLPTVRGEKVVIRILDGQRIPLALSALGMDDQARRCLEKLIRCRQGLILICGPTGSGKTTTLYAALHEIQDDSVSIATLEDPVEILMEGLSQSQVQAKGGMMFQDGLRALLRQDPDILVVGEIRDSETARIAVRAALTGHVIFSTLHAPSAVEAVVRLTDMGIAPYLAADALAGVVSQRLVRRKSGKGGYEGRFCLCEVVPAGRHLREAIRCRAGVSELTGAARTDGAVLLPDVISRALAAGWTDEREIRRVCEGGGAGWT